MESASKTSSLQRNLPAIIAAVRNVIIFTTVLSIPLTAAQTMKLSTIQTGSWILAFYGIPSLISLVLAVFYHQPLQLTGNLFVIIFISGLGGRYSFQELIGASILAGAGVLLITSLGLMERLARLVPVPIMYGMLAGALLPFVVNIFSTFGAAPLLVGMPLAAYLLSRFLLGERFPAILPAVVLGFIGAAATGAFEPLNGSLSSSLPALTLPVFSLPAILTVTPVIIVLITLQANLPSLRFLQNQEYRPPEKIIGFISGLGTMLGSLLGPIGISLSLPVTSVIAGPEAGERAIRHRSIYWSSVVGLLIGLLAGFAIALAQVIPRALLLTLAGLAVMEVLANALKKVTQGPLLLGPLFAFVIALSDMSFLGFDHYFWALVIGTGVSILIEREGLQELRSQSEDSR